MSVKINEGTTADICHSPYALSLASINGVYMFQMAILRHILACYKHTAYAQ